MHFNDVHAQPLNGFISMGHLSLYNLVIRMQISNLHSLTCHAKSVPNDTLINNRSKALKKFYVPFSYGILRVPFLLRCQGAFESMLNLIFLIQNWLKIKIFYNFLVVIYVYHCTIGIFMTFPILN